MRQVFSSVRLENVEGVANLLRSEGIEIQIINGRSYKGNRRGNFSYRDTPTTERPAVWVVRSDEQPRARELLRGAGLLQSGAAARGYLPQDEVVFASDSAPPKQKLSRVAKIRYALLGGAVLVIGLTSVQRYWPASTPDVDPIAATSAPAQPALDMVPPTVQASVHRIAVPSALAEALLASELAEIEGPVCLAIDGEDPAPSQLQRLHATNVGALACSQRSTEPAPPLRSIEIVNYRTDGSGQGTVDVVADDPTRGSVTRSFDVEREGRDWRFKPAG